MLQIMTSICFTTPSSNDFQTYQKIPVINPKNMAKLITKSDSHSRTITILDSPKNFDNSNNKQDYFKKFGRLLTRDYMHLQKLNDHYRRKNYWRRVDYKVVKSERRKNSSTKSSRFLYMRRMRRILSGRNKQGRRDYFD